VSRGVRRGRCRIRRRRIPRRRIGASFVATGRHRGLVLKLFTYCETAEDGWAYVCRHYEDDPHDPRD
jgi:hypothetical protein